MDTQKPTLTVTQALAEGYTHFAMGSEEEFWVYPISNENLTNQIEEWDKSMHIEHYGGTIPPRICSKETHSPSITPKVLAEILAERFSLDDELAPALVQSFEDNIHTEEPYIEAVKALNNCFSEYRTYSHTDILLTLD